MSRSRNRPHRPWGTRHDTPTRKPLHKEGLATCDLCGRSDDHTHPPEEYGGPNAPTPWADREDRDIR